MNLLAHAFLAHPDSQIADKQRLLGNVMADTIKGRACLDSLQPNVRAGVLQHRAIDRFTDEHSYCIVAHRRFVSIRPLYRAPVFDIFMDRLLARSWSRWSDEPLETFAERVRVAIDELRALHVPRFRSLAHRIQTNGAVLKATTPEGLRFLLERIGESWGDEAILLLALDDFARHEDDLLAGFLDFFAELRHEARRFDQPVV